MLTAFVAIIGVGYITAVLNIRYSHAMADGVEGLSLDDVRAVYSGLTVDRSAPMPSRMLTMIQTSMREYIGTEAEFDILAAWLEAGGTQAGLDDGEGKRTPRRIIMRRCLECHAQNMGKKIAQTAPFAPDDFDVDYSMIAKFSSPGEPTTGDAVRLPPQLQVPRLILVSHIHMLAIPVFALIVGVLFAMTRLPPGPRSLLTPIPMITLMFDFAGWWLARQADVFVYVIVTAGGLFGLVFGVQLIVIIVDLWRPATTLDAAK